MINKKRLIDVNDVYSLFDEDGFATLHVTDIDTIPRVDAVEVVRCKDCVSHNICKFEQFQGLNGFCSYGERKCNGK